jgi:hypothetical protein
MGVLTRQKNLFKFCIYKILFFMNISWLRNTSGSIIEHLEVRNIFTYIILIASLSIYIINVIIPTLYG